MINHHPKIIIEDGNVYIELYTHDLNDITSLDLELSKVVSLKINTLLK